MCRIEDMCSPVTQRPHTEIVPATPLSVMEVLVVIVIITGHQPGVPIKCFRHRFCGWKFFDVGIPTMPAARVVHMRSNRCYILDDACFFPCLELKVVGLGVALVSHLCNYPGIFSGCLHHQFRLKKSAAQRFLHIDMLPPSHRHHHCWEMGEVGRGDGNSVNLIAHLVEHLPEILEPFCIREFGQCLPGMLSSHIHVAQGHHIGQSGIIEILDNVPPSVSYTNMGHVHFFIGSYNAAVACSVCSGRYTPEGKTCGSQCCISDKFSSCCHDKYVL